MIRCAYCGKQVSLLQQIKQGRSAVKVCSKEHMEGFLELQTEALKHLMLRQAQVNSANVSRPLAGVPPSHAAEHSLAELSLPVASLSELAPALVVQEQPAQEQPAEENDDDVFATLKLAGSIFREPQPRNFPQQLLTDALEPAPATPPTLRCDHTAAPRLADLPQWTGSSNVELFPFAPQLEASPRAPAIRAREPLFLDDAFFHALLPKLAVPFPSVNLGAPSLTGLPEFSGSPFQGAGEPVMAAYDSFPARTAAPASGSPAWQAHGLASAGMLNLDPSQAQSTLSFRPPVLESFEVFLSAPVLEDRAATPLFEIVEDSSGQIPAFRIEHLFLPPIAPPAGTCIATVGARLLSLNRGSANQTADLGRGLPAFRSLPLHILHVVSEPAISFEPLPWVLRGQAVLC